MDFFWATILLVFNFPLSLAHLPITPNIEFILLRSNSEWTLCTGAGTPEKVLFSFNDTNVESVYFYHWLLSSFIFSQIIVYKNFQTFEKYQISQGPHWHSQIACFFPLSNVMQICRQWLRANPNIWEARPCLAVSLYKWLKLYIRNQSVIPSWHRFNPAVEIAKQE